MHSALDKETLINVVGTLENKDWTAICFFSKQKCNIGGCVATQYEPYDHIKNKHKYLFEDNLIFWNVHNDIIITVEF